MTEPREVTRLLEAYRAGDREAFHSIVALVYEDLRKIAHRRLRAQSGGRLLDTTELVHEAYIRLGAQSSAAWENRPHFLAAAAQAMRHILIDFARTLMREKRGGGRVRVHLDESEIALDQEAESLVRLDQAMDGLKEVDPRLVEVVECRFFGGMTEVETAEALGMSRRTVQRDWERARAWLKLELGR